MLHRRSFIQSLSGFTTSLLFASDAISLQTKKRDRLGEIMPQRTLGRTGEEVTMLGVGGYHFAKNSESESEAIIEAALEGGVRFFDNAAVYHEGLSEERMGKLLTPKYRDVVFLMTKSMAENAEDAKQEIDASLKRLNTDYLDLWQVHGIMSPEDIENRIAEGVLEIAQKAKAAGKIRHIGFTGHRAPKGLVHALELTGDNKDLDIFETCQMPTNVLDPSYDSFINIVLPKLIEKNIGVLAMKTLAIGRFFEKHVVPDRISLN
ncbi:MAG: aldo/keto reductase, partial [bacterium]